MGDSAKIPGKLGQSSGKIKWKRSWAEALSYNVKLNGHKKDEDQRLQLKLVLPVLDPPLAVPREKFLARFFWEKNDSHTHSISVYLLFL